MHGLGQRRGYVLVAMKTKLKTVADRFLDLRSIHVIGTDRGFLNAVVPNGNLQLVGATGVPQIHSALPNGATRNRAGITKAVIAGDRVEGSGEDASIA